MCSITLLFVQAVAALLPLFEAFDLHAFDEAPQLMSMEKKEKGLELELESLSLLYTS